MSKPMTMTTDAVDGTFGEVFAAALEDWEAAGSDAERAQVWMATTMGAVLALADATNRIARILEDGAR